MSPKYESTWGEQPVLLSSASNNTRTKCVTINKPHLHLRLQNKNRIMINLHWIYVTNVILKNKLLVCYVTGPDVLTGRFVGRLSLFALSLVSSWLVI